MKNLRPRKMQMGGPSQANFPDYESWSKAQEEYIQSLGPVPQEKYDTRNTWNNFPALNAPAAPSNPYGTPPDINRVTGYNPTVDGGALNNGRPLVSQMGDENAKPIYNDGTSDNPDWKIQQDQKKKGKLDPYFMLRGATTGLSWLAGMVDRNRQDKYARDQYSTLGQLDPLPVSNFQPTPYNLYAQKGGNFFRGNVNPKHRGK